MTTARRNEKFDIRGINHLALVCRGQASPTLTPSTFVRSIYFLDPDGILLEFAAWTRELDERDVNGEYRVEESR